MAGLERNGGGPLRAVMGYTPDEKLRLQQLRELWRCWLKEQELSLREPVLPLQKPGLVEGFWQNFLKPGGLWRTQPYGVVAFKPKIFPGFPKVSERNFIFKVIYFNLILSNIVIRLVI
uniref:NADH dehydrogenase [ubiquinone] 1 beta subcomplex subunit 6 n=1 Tax=Anolis carolinensis TaxID=28377 RepID=A0A803TAL9_ANOCA